MQHRGNFVGGHKIPPGNFVWEHKIPPRDIKFPLCNIGEILCGDIKFPLCNIGEILCGSLEEHSTENALTLLQFLNASCWNSVTIIANGPFRKLSRAMLVTSF